MKKIVFGICLIVIAFLINGCNSDVNEHKVLLFTKTKGYHHESIAAGIDAIKKIGEDNKFSVDVDSTGSSFNDDALQKYKAIIFLSTTGNILNSDEQVALERYIEAGGGFVGIHAAADAEYNWGWYNKLVGAYFKNHPGDPNVRKATVVVSDTDFVAMKGIPEKWERTDEWYNYKSINADLHVVAKLDEDSYEGGENGKDHPIAWYHDFDGGRAFYTGGGHTTESYGEPLFLKHLEGGIKYAMGADTAKLDYSKSYATKAPEENRFSKTVLSNDLNEPMEIAVTPANNVYIIERSGNFYIYKPSDNSTTVIHKFKVLPDTKEAFGNGLLGMTIDPDFATNKFVYFFYSPDSLATPTHQNISRFTMVREDSIDMVSEKVIIQVPIDPEVSAHTGGSLAWDSNKNLFISTGDNTVPFESNGYAPLDERPGRKTFDAQRSAGNTNDLRGKIIRIHPETDGSYTIPAGNLFKKGETGTRPEIYAMGCRNPYRICVNQETSTVYWGEVGPDAGDDSKYDPRGYDEFNQAKKPGNYGWPYFVGDSKPYHDSDFATHAIGNLFDVSGPENNSPNNTGLKKLPATTKAMVWYPYKVSDEFPDLGDGGRTAIAGAFYHYNKSTAKKTGIPSYYDNCLFVMDWMRNWVFAVRFDKDENYKRMEAFMPLTGDFRRPIDMQITKGGVMYVLEYGSVYGADNDDARLVRVDYNDGNRAPVAVINANDSIGLAPLKVNFKSDNSFDYDEDDQLKYEWKFEGDKVGSTDANPTYIFQNKGVYHVTLKITDPSGASSIDTMEIKAGNTIPEISINTTANQTFYFNEPTRDYAIEVHDKEDAAIDASRIHVKLDYVPADAGSYKFINGNGVLLTPGKDLIQLNDCKACHTYDHTVVGPAFTAISEKYKNAPGEVSRLASKIITGGAGVWGNHYMNAHPQISKEDAVTIVKYILSLSKLKTTDSLPAKGSVQLQPPSGSSGGSWVLTASYTDMGNGVVPLTASKQLVLRQPFLKSNDANNISGIQRYNNMLGATNNNAWFVFKNLDLKDIKQVTYSYAAKDNAATLEIHLDSVKGKLISTLNYQPSGAWEKFKQASTAVAATEGLHNLYFVFKKEGEIAGEGLCLLDWIKFSK